MIDADLIGIGKLLKQSRFSVPPHQRPYAWPEGQVMDLYRYINDALKRNKEEYFLGTIVLAKGDDGRLSIIDGQQRLVTTSILIAAIRDYFDANGQKDRAREIEREYLSKRDIRAMEDTAHLHLIPEDRDFFVKRVVRAHGHADRDTLPTSPAQQRIARAIELAAGFVDGITKTTQNADDALLDLLAFLDEQGKLISMAVGDEANAFVIFEVLNDRGLDLSVSDLLKNFIFRHAGDRLAEAQNAWQRMSNTITDVAEEPDIKVFIRQAWIATHGLTREKQLYDAIKRQVTNKQKAIEYIKGLGEDALVYAALRNPRARAVGPVRGRGC